MLGFCNFFGIYFLAAFGLDFLLLDFIYFSLSNYNENKCVYVCVYPFTLFTFSSHCPLLDRPYVLTH